MMGMQQQQQKQTLLTVQDSYIRSRTQAVENIGQTIIELQVRATPTLVLLLVVSLVVRRRCCFPSTHACAGEQGIFTQLATIVAEQGEMMQRIDANINEVRFPVYLNS